MSGSNIFTFFVPENLQADPYLFRKSKLVAGVVVSLIFLGVIMSVRFFATGMMVGGFAIVFCVFLSFGLLYSIRLSGSVIWASNGVILVLFCVLTYLIGKKNGIYAETNSWFVIVVLLGFMLTGFWTSIFWAASSAVVVCVFYFMELGGHGFEHRDPNPTIYFISFILLVVVIAVQAYILNASSVKNQKELAREKENSEKKAGRLDEAIDEVQKIMNEISNYNLADRVKGIYEGKLEELKTSINQSVEILGGTIYQSKTVSGEVYRNAIELSQSAQTLSNGAAQQASGLEEISAAMDDIGSQAKANNENAVQAQALSNQAQQGVENGNRMMESMLTSMKEINETSSNMTKVIKIIDEIAFQTNLLALNAAVEAARAGKYGKGFAVVAEEVRNLAGRSSEAAKETNDLIEKSVKEIENGSTKADDTAKSLNDISELVLKVNDLIGEISAASQNQNVSIQEINKNLNNMNQIVQQNSSISEQTAAASDHLSSQSSSLQNLLSNFRFEGESHKKNTVLPNPAKARIVPKAYQLEEP